MKKNAKPKSYYLVAKFNKKTRRFDEATSTTLLMRVKGSSDYRYFPEPDVPRFQLMMNGLKKFALVCQKCQPHVVARYISELGLPEYDAMVLTLTKEMSDFFEATLANGADAKQASNWLMGEVSAYLNSEKVELADTKLTPENLAGMITLINDGTISSKIAKKVFKRVSENGGDAKEVVEAKGLVQLSDPAQLYND